ncbi:MAG: prenyltransferase [Methanomassiliicoccus sp.]|nr:MAG: prenyltransferase [Methanomassiliicoccus sp.]
MASLHKTLYVIPLPAFTKSLISGHYLTSLMANRIERKPIEGLFRLLRPANCLMGAAGTLLASIICVGPEEFLDYGSEVLFSLLVVIFFTGAGNSLNDYFDREIDKTAHPERPIPRGLVSPRSALILSVVSFSIAIILSSFINLWSLGIVLTSILFMISYEVSLKREGLAGNLAISWLTGALFLFGGAAVDRMEVAWILGALAFLATLGREIVKDIQDVQGDRGIRLTLPMRIGARNAGFVASLSFIGAVLLSPVPYMQELLSIYYVPIVLVSDAIFIYCATIHFADPKRGQKVAKLAMLVALIAFLFGGII